MHAAYYKSDIAIAITHGISMASALGISSCRMGLSEIIFNRDKRLRTQFQIPANERVDGIVAFGYSSVDWRRIPPRGPAKVTWK